MTFGSRRPDAGPAVRERRMDDVKGFVLGRLDFQFPGASRPATSVAGRLGGVDGAELGTSERRTGCFREDWCR